MIRGASRLGERAAASRRRLGGRCQVRPNLESSTIGLQGKAPSAGDDSDFHGGIRTRVLAAEGGEVRAPRDLSHLPLVGRPWTKTQGRRPPAREGFYAVDAAAKNPKSRWHRSFDIGFPNAFDRAHGRTGTFLMVHGGCSSVGCYAVTDLVIDEIWTLLTAAFAARQQRVAVHIFPIRLTDGNLARTVQHPWHAFWGELRIGHELFERDKLPPRVGVCQGRHHFEPALTIRDAGVASEPQRRPRQQARSL